MKEQGRKYYLVGSGIMLAGFLTVARMTQLGWRVHGILNGSTRRLRVQSPVSQNPNNNESPSPSAIDKPHAAQFTRPTGMPARRQATR